MQKEKERILNWLNAYKTEKNCKGVVLGLSGGKDSTVVAMLAKMVWGDNVLAVMMPNGNQADIDDSYAIAKTLGLNYRVVNVGAAFAGLMYLCKQKQEEETLTSKPHM